MNHHTRCCTMARASLVLAIALSLAACRSEPVDGDVDTSTETTPAQPVAPAPAEPPAVVSITQTFQCGDRRIEAVYAPDAVLLDLGDRELILPATVAASGARYGDGDPEFWARGLDQAVLTLDGQHYDCAVLEPGTRSPWAEARERGVGFRAVGSEPGWHVEVGMGEAPTMRIVLDYGERELDVERSEPFAGADGASGFRGEVDGEALELSIRREDCADPMSGEAFEASATLDYQGQAYQACGRFLQE
jgi:membrane-bound inhibitor of C-type lysozyme